MPKRAPSSGYRSTPTDRYKDRPSTQQLPCLPCLGIFEFRTQTGRFAKVRRCPTNNRRPSPFRVASGFVQVHECEHLEPTTRPTTRPTSEARRTAQARRPRATKPQGVDDRGHQGPEGNDEAEDPHQAHLRPTVDRARSTGTVWWCFSFRCSGL